jgi:hypothetical protein
MPAAIPEYNYPLGFLKRKVNNSGDMGWKRGRVVLSEVFRREEIALEHMGEGIYRAFYRHLELGEFDSAELKFYPRRKAI